MPRGCHFDIDDQSVEPILQIVHEEAKKSNNFRRSSKLIRSDFHKIGT